MRLNDAFGKAVPVAIAYIRKWRDTQGLDALSPSEERAAASKLIAQKGWGLPEKMAVVYESYFLKDGVYQLMEIKDTIEISVDSVLNAPPSTPDLYPWNPQDKQEFWCDKLSFFVRLTGDLNVDGTYFVNKIGDGTFRRYGVRGGDLVPKNQAHTNSPKSDLLAVNRASWGDIKNFLTDKFIPSYPWTKRGDKTPTEVRADMEALAKSRNKGLAKLIEEERDADSFDDAQNLATRMTARHESFPWMEFAQMLDFCL